MKLAKERKPIEDRLQYHYPDMKEKDILFKELKKADTQKILDQYEKFLKDKFPNIDSIEIEASRLRILDFIEDFLFGMKAGIYV